ncbi:Sugar transferase involved in LPS biosynthesis (colanic, teichoic acid) [Flagellimonas taeanensis]|jgi:lipopolysaccharide/colanic/teichoic acid biosynthesis glycosyltransferase|uniref:Sugar transferase involved in LPS biosynthesis (Colanic, teichoic acid) n=1 Tax=Flagellimonas taeanensis TaxID=1005926 RepID=A0A1M6V1X4_9FLAO|nr:sugar transferase [Allomuricauda taeanensis]SFC21324.1 Sugar transferase involved in LPS biosynthesis (colanic, teichoic acid) [Allomuricauda taeanensis]SHK75440.1 Sugar transferase involved in LPS biosynthesis (colanic, teichoic acid) [Allomuricauda taeanensis]
MYNHLFKPLIDFVLSLVLILLVSPLLAVIIIVLTLTNKGTPFFLQPRPGKNGRIFKIIKFKTMRDLDPGSTMDVHNLNRVTKAGHLIRKYSLDELLQLVNVLKGDMSLVGPRPLLVEYLPLYNEVQGKRHLVRPGITGWAQVNGRNSISWTQKFELDVWYVDHLSFSLDLKILYLTLIKVVKKKDINQGIDKTMPVWEGN